MKSVKNWISLGIVILLIVLMFIRPQGLLGDTKLK